MVLHLHPAKIATFLEKLIRKLKGLDKLYQRSTISVIKLTNLHTSLRKSSMSRIWLDIWSR